VRRLETRRGVDEGPEAGGQGGALGSGGRHQVFRVLKKIERNKKKEGERECEKEREFDRDQRGSKGKNPHLREREENGARSFSLDARSARDRL